MPPRVEQLKTRIEVDYRDSINIIQQTVSAHVEEIEDKEYRELKGVPKHILFIDPSLKGEEESNSDKGGEEDDKKEEIAKIDVMEIATVKPKDYLKHDSETAMTVPVFALMIIRTMEVRKEKVGGTRFIPPWRCSMTFKDRGQRDLWASGLRTLTLGTLEKRGAGKDMKPRDKLLPITKVVPMPPRPDVIASIKLDLGDEKPNVYLDVDEKISSAEDCKKLVHSFMMEHNVLPSEGTSLYRYVRSVVQRMLMERQTQQLVTEISNLSLDRLRLMDEHKNRDKNELLAMARKGLHSLSQKLPDRLGTQGAGAAILACVFKRNIDKMVLINEMAAKRVDSYAAAASFPAPPPQIIDMDSRQPLPEPSPNAPSIVV